VELFEAMKSYQKLLAKIVIVVICWLLFHSIEKQFHRANRFYRSCPKDEDILVDNLMWQVLETPEG
jgi:hypothetical protein